MYWSYQYRHFSICDSSICQGKLKNWHTSFIYQPCQLSYESLLKEIIILRVVTKSKPSQSEILTLTEHLICVRYYSKYLYGLPSFS